MTTKKLPRRLLRTASLPVLLLFWVGLAGPWSQWACAADGDGDQASAPFHSLSAAQRQQLRLVVLAPHLVESMFEIGAGKQIIGTVDHADYPAAANAIPRMGNHARLQIERILQVQPDAVIAWKTGNPIEDLQRLRQYGIVVIESHPQRLDDVAAELRLLGAITGREAVAEAIAANFLLQLHTLREKYRNAPPVTVFYELWSRPLRTVAGSAWPQQQLEVCGGVNPFAEVGEDYPQVSLEKALANQPQVIIQPSKHSRASADALNWRQWPDIPAVKHNFIIYPDADRVLRMTSRMLQEVIDMCAQIDDARTFYNP